MKSSLLLFNGHIYTQDKHRPKATAVAISGNKIQAIGDDASLKRLIGNDWQHVDLQGRCVVPGLVDAHVHFRSYSLGLQRIDLMNSRTLEDALALVAERAAPNTSDGWILGRGWNQSDWLEDKFPAAANLDRIVPNHPVYLIHKSGHAAWVNSRALRLAHIESSTPDPPGGQIQRDDQGRATGILFEDAIDLVAAQVPEPTESEVVNAMLEAQERCLRAGLTGIHDFDGRSCFQALQTLHGNEDLKLRVVKNIPVYRLEHAIGVGLRSGFGDDWLRIGGVKIFADGALGPRTAAMIAPYEGQPGNWGIVVTDKEEMLAYASQASQNGLSVTIHAIGDRANHDVLDVYEVVRAEELGRSTLGDDNSQLSRLQSSRDRFPPSKLRHRIEHAQLLHPDDFARLARLNVIASMQPIHATSDMEMAGRYWGDRARNSYAWRKVLDAGANMVFGSDAPIDPIEPLGGIYAAVSRRRPDGTPGPQGWYPEQRLTVAEAVHAFTMGAAFTSGREGEMGTISPGKLADLTIFDRDIFTIHHDEMLDVQISGTIIDGEFRYRTW